jgi:hypothetical protein
LAVATAITVVAALHAVRKGYLSPNEQRVTVTLTIAFVASYVLMAVFALVTNLNWQPRHSFFLALPVFLLLPLAVRGRGDARSTSWQVLGAVAVTIVILANLWSLGHSYWDRAYARDDYRAVAGYVKSHKGGGQRSVLLFGYPELLRYYGDGATLEGMKLPTDRLAESVRALTQRAPEVVLISNREWAFWRQPESIVEAMSPEYRFEGEVRFPYFVVYRFALR